MKLTHRHQCDQCGHIAPWDEYWQRYSSIAHDETCPELMPEFCSEPCRKKFMARLKQGEVRLPKLRIKKDKFNFEVRKAGKGYGVFALEIAKDKV